MDDATTLTDADLEQFAIVDAKLAKRAHARRAGYSTTFTDSERKARAQPVTFGEFDDFITDVIFPKLATYRFRIEESRKQIAALESRVLELEARAATSHLAASPVPGVEDLVL